MLFGTGVSRTIKPLPQVTKKHHPQPHLRNPDSNVSIGARFDYFAGEDWAFGQRESEPTKRNECRPLTRQRFFCLHICSLSFKASSALHEGFGFDHWTESQRACWKKRKLKNENWRSIDERKNAHHHTFFHPGYSASFASFRTQAYNRLSRGEIDFFDDFSRKRRTGVGVNHDHQPDLSTTASSQFFTPTSPCRRPWREGEFFSSWNMKIFPAQTTENEYHDVRSPKNFLQ